MAELSFFRFKENAKYYTTQRLQNFFPENFRIRESEYSLGAQLYNPLSGILEEQNLNVQRVIHNYLPQTFSEKEIDKVYQIPNILGTSTTFKAYYDSSNYVNPERIEGGIDEFWYSPILNRIELESTATIIKPVSRNASKVYKNSVDYLYSIENTNSFLNSDLSGYVGTNTEYSTSTESNGLELLKLYTTSTSASQISLLMTSTEQVYNKELVFLSYLKFDELACDQIIAEIGIDGIGTATSTISINKNQYKVLNLYYPEQTSTGNPFVNLYFNNSTDLLSTGGLYIFKDSQYLLNNDYQIRDNTSSPTIDFVGEKDFGWCWINVQNGTSLGNPNYRIAGQPAFFIVKGISVTGFKNSELIACPFNGQHRGNILWEQILSVEPINFSQNLEYEVSLRNNFSNKNILNPLQLYVDRFFESPLFYSLSIEEGRSFLNFNTFDDLAIDLITPEYQTKKVFELLDASGGSLELIDFALNNEEQIIYAVDTSKLYVYEAFDLMPSKTSLEFVKDNRSIAPGMKLFEEDRYLNVKKDSSILIEGDWIRKDSYLKKYRLSVKKPDGTLKSISSSGTEANIELNTNWIEYEDIRSVIQNKDSMFKPIRVPYLIDQYGDYCFCLEAEYIEDDLETSFKEKDVIIIQCKRKTALKEFSFSIPSTPTYIDINPDGVICVGFEEDDISRNLTKELKFRNRFDYYLYTGENSPIYLREKYKKIVLDIEDYMCKRKVVIVDSNYNIQDDEVECGLVFVKTGGGPVNIYFPEITADVDGSEVTVCRWGGNYFDLFPNALSSDTIDGDASLRFNVDKMSYTFIAVKAENLWKII